MTRKTDQYYIKQTLNGNIGAFSELVNRYKDLVFTLALRTMKQREEAEEIAQDTFLKAYTSLHQFKGDSKFSTWIYKIAYHNCLDRLRKLNNQLKTVEVGEIKENLLYSMDNALKHMEESEYRQVIQHCLNLLPGDDGFLLTLYYYEDLSLKEISTITNLSVANIKVRLFRGRRRLCLILKEHLTAEIINYYEK